MYQSRRVVSIPQFFDSRKHSLLVAFSAQRETPQQRRQKPLYSLSKNTLFKSLTPEERMANLEAIVASSLAAVVLVVFGPMYFYSVAHKWPEWVWQSIRSILIEVLQMAAGFYWGGIWSKETWVEHPVATTMSLWGFVFNILSLSYTIKLAIYHWRTGNPMAYVRTFDERNYTSEASSKLAHGAALCCIVSGAGLLALPNKTNGCLFASDLVATIWASRTWRSAEKWFQEVRRVNEVKKRE